MANAATDSGGQLLRATASPFRSGRVLPRMIAILIINEARLIQDAHPGGAQAANDIFSPIP
jgi:hypothetical protein